MISLRGNGLDPLLVTHGVSSLSENDVRAVTFDQVKQEALNDQEMQDLIAAIENKAGQDTFPDTVLQYQRYSDKLLVLDGVPMYGRRIIVQDL